MDAKPRIFITRSYTYRKPATLFGGLLALASASFALNRLIVEFPRSAWSWGALPTMLFVGGIGALLGFCGFWVLRQWFASASMLLEITDAGIRYGDAHCSWDDIRWISGHGDRKGIVLFYQRRGSLVKRGDQHMPVDPDLTLEEYQDLMHELNSALSERHPDVTFG
jgi:hypothetical protein